MPYHDYSQGSYFITICTKNRECFFGHISNLYIEFSTLGKIARQLWMNIPDTFHGVRLDEFVIMPNHVHGIITIEKIYRQTTCRNTPRRVPTTKHIRNGLQPLSKNSLSSIINHYKGGVTKYCRKNKLEFFEWQPRFYDRVIRDHKELYRIRQYIRNNPKKWIQEKNYPENYGK